MTLDEKKKCSEIWKMASGEYIDPKDWTDNAGDELAAFLAEVKTCSTAMTFVPKPCGSRPGRFWVVTYVYDVLKNMYNMNKDQIFGACLTFSVNQYKQSIAAQCL
jgi:hypothetical protein